MNVDLTRPTLALLIDCWHDTSSPQIDETWHHVADVCYTNQSIKAVANASYWGYNYDVWQENPWYAESDFLFNQTTKWDFLREDWKRFNFRDLENTQQKIRHTSPIIKNMKARTDQLQLNIFNTLQLIYFCNYVNPSIRNILLMGQAWSICLKNRGVGWDEINYVIQYDMFTHPMTLITRQDCVLGSDNQYPQISSPWIQIDQLHYVMDYSQHSINT
jgi:hypothetical protein